MASQHAGVGIDPGLLKQQSAVLPLHHIGWYNNTSAPYDTITRRSTNQAWKGTVSLWHITDPVGYQTNLSYFDEKQQASKLK